MLKIDAHQHFWQYKPERDSWIGPAMTAIARDFMPVDLKPLLAAEGFDGCIIIQSDESEAENDFQLANARANDFVKGVVGWVDFCADNIEERLKAYSEVPLMKGFRYMYTRQPLEEAVQDRAFLKGLSLLQQYNFTFDLLLQQHQLAVATSLVARFPEQVFIIDHIAKPAIKNGEIEGWKQGIEAIAQYPNVCCKLSGMVTEADWGEWKEAEIIPFMDTVLDSFGSDRLLFGSDWPVCLLAGSYQRVHELVQRYTQELSYEDQEKIWGGNAAFIYKL